MEYRLVAASKPDDIVKSVNELLKEGYVVTGGIAVQGGVWAQALIKEEK